jgi:hypothetical protein
MVIFENHFTALLHQNISILDVGGTEDFWVQMGYHHKSNMRFTLLNIANTNTHHGNFTSLVGDARKLDNLQDSSSDIVFSNSVLEHVGTFDDQILAANHIRRIGKSYFVQTPNYWFPVERHFLFVGYQYLPLSLRAFFLRRFNLGWFSKAPDKAELITTVSSIRLLTKRNMRTLFPEAEIVTERFAGLSKSIIAVKSMQVE